MTQEKYELIGLRFFIIDELLDLNIEETIEGAYERVHEYLDGRVKTRWYEKEGKIHGPSRFYGQEGELLSETWFVNGVKEGRASRYFPSGEVYSLERFKAGKPHLLHESFFEGGVRKSVIPYKEGKLHGQVELFWPSGQIKRRCEYNESELVGEDQMFDEGGDVIHTEKSLS